MPKVIKKTVEQVTTQAFRDDLVNKIKQNQAYCTQYLGSYGKLPTLPANLDADLEECLQQEPLEKLCAIYKDVTGDTLYLENKRKAAEKKQEGIFSFFEPIIEIFTKLFSGEGGGFFGQLMEMFQQMNISFNPGADLTAKEKEMSEHSSLFVKASEKLPDLAKDINHLYRKLQKETNTGEQIFNGLLRHIKTMGASQAREAHKLLKLAEMQLLGGKIATTDAVLPGGLAETVEARVKLNLLKAYAKVNPTTQVDATGTLVPALPHLALTPAQQDDVNRINSAARAVKNLITEINTQEMAIKRCSLKEDKAAIYYAMQENKRKIFHFIAKSDAMAEGETLKPGKSLDLAYMQKQLDKYPLDNELRGHLNLLNGGGAPVTENKSIFKLFVINVTNVANGADRVSHGAANEDLKNQDAFQQAIQEAQDHRFKEMAEKISKSQKVVVDINAEWVKIEKTIEATNRQLNPLGAPIGAGPQRDELEKRIGELQAKQAGLESEAVTIQKHINQQLINQKVYKSDELRRKLAAAFGTPNHAQIQIDKTAFDLITQEAYVTQEVMRMASVLLDANPGKVIPALGRAQPTGALHATQNTTANFPTTIAAQFNSVLEQFNITKQLQRNVESLFEMAEDAIENCVPRPTKKMRNTAVPT